MTGAIASELCCPSVPSVSVDPCGGRHLATRHPLKLCGAVDAGSAQSAHPPADHGHVEAAPLAEASRPLSRPSQIALKELAASHAGRVLATRQQVKRASLPTRTPGSSSLSVVPPRKEIDLATRERIRDWVKWWMKRNDKIPADVARIAGISPGAVSRMMSLRSVGLDVFIKVTRRLKPLDAERVLNDPAPSDRPKV